MATRCDCCGTARTFFFGMTTADGERVEVTMTGFEDELAAVTSALAGLRSHKRTIERREPSLPPPAAIRVVPRDLVGAGEIAERLGTTKNAVVNWAGRYDDFPAPVIDHLQMGRIWRWSEVNTWYDAHPWSSRHTTT